MNALATLTEPRSLLTDMARRYGMEPAPFEATLRATVAKGNVTREELAAGLLVCREYGLNPLTKEIYFFPAKGGGIVPVLSVDGWSRIINDHPAFDGMDFVELREGGKLVSVTCRMHRKDRSRPTEIREDMAECVRSTDVWRQWPARMLRHKAMIQCARMAFGFSGMVDPDEYERMSDAAPQQVRVLHAGFEAPAAPAPAPEPQPQEAQETAQEAEEIADAVFEPAEPQAAQAAPPEPAAAPAEPETTQPEAAFDLIGWAVALNRGLDRIGDIDALRERWAEHKEGLKTVNPTMFKELNRAVAARAAQLSGVAGGF